MHNDMHTRTHSHIHTGTHGCPATCMQTHADTCAPSHTLFSFHNFGVRRPLTAASGSLKTETGSRGSVAPAFSDSQGLSTPRAPCLRGRSPVAKAFPPGPILRPAGWQGDQGLASSEGRLPCWLCSPFLCLHLCRCLFLPGRLQALGARLPQGFLRGS